MTDRRAHSAYGQQRLEKMTPEVAHGERGSPAVRGTLDRRDFGSPSSARFPVQL